jgi:hypothetical protein
MYETKPTRRPEQFRRSGRLAFVLAVLASTAWTPVARASDFPAVIRLSSLDGNIGFRLDGSSAPVATAGDVNGDGFADLIAGAPGPKSRGPSYVVFGKASGFAATIDLSSLDGSNGFRLDGKHRLDQTSYSVASAGDVNGDGFADVIIGAYRADPAYSGSSYVVFGRAPDTAVDRVGSAASQYIRVQGCNELLKLLEIDKPW